MVRAIVLSQDDNVATLVDPGKEGEPITLSGEATGEVTLTADIAFGHKLAIRPITAGQPILKYGKVIGQDSGGVDSVAEVKDLVAEHLGIEL